VEYLLWWEKSEPVAAPLVSGNANPHTIAALNDPGTVILIGAGSNQSTDFGAFSGIRATFGGWIDRDESYGFEASGLLLPRHSFGFAAASAGGTAPIVSLPFNATAPFTPVGGSVNPAGETSLNSGNAPNTVVASVSSRLWGAEGNGLVQFLNDGRFRLAGLAGFRYLDLDENLRLTDTNLDALTNGVVSVTDSFGTRNQFYGGQLGARAGWSYHRWTLDLTAKVALGSNHEVANINGTTLVTNGAFGFASGVTAAGVFAQPSNIGHFSRDVFAVVPEGQVQFGYQLTERIHPFLGYSFLYLSDALRPGNQVSHNINPQNPVFIAPGTTVGALAPLPSFHSSSFWTQGINFGIEIRY
jgi:hypothetical protein